MRKEEDLGEILQNCVKILDENMEILSDVEISLEMEKDDVIVTEMDKTDLIDMVQEISESVRVKKAESNFIRRHLEKSQ